MDIDAKTRSDLILRYKRIEQIENVKNQKQSGTLNFLIAKRTSIKNGPEDNTGVKPIETDTIAIPTKIKVPRPQTKLVALEEDDYFCQIENIIRRDYYPDLEKLHALRDYEKAQVSGDKPSVPSVLLKESDRSKASHMVGASTVIRNRGLETDPADLLISRMKEIKSITPSDKNQKILTLDQYLHKFTSEDNASFFNIHAGDKQTFQDKLAILGVAPNELAILGAEKSKVQAIEPENKDVFFNGYQLISVKPKNNESEEVQTINSQILPHKRISKRCTRLPTEYQLKMQAQEKLKPKTKAYQNFNVPLTREEIEQQQKKDSMKTIDLQALIQDNKFGGQHQLEDNLSCDTPVINGYKIIRDTPARSECIKSKFSVPNIPKREELGVLLANQSQIKKRQQKEQDKKTFQQKLELSTPRSQSGKSECSYNSKTSMSKRSTFSQAGKQLLSRFREGNASIRSSGPFSSNRKPSLIGAGIVTPKMRPQHLN